MYDHGFDLTGFRSPDVFSALLKRHGISSKPRRVKAYVGNRPAGWFWTGKGITMVTANNPLTGQRYDGNDASWGVRKGYASYIGITGDEAKVKALVADIKKTTKDIKDESVGTRDFI